jgi:hypothetical protein
VADPTDRFTVRALHPGSAEVWLMRGRARVDLVGSVQESSGHWYGFPGEKWRSDQSRTVSGDTRRAAVHKLVAAYREAQPAT